MSIHIHLYDCNCIFCTSDSPIDFFQTHNDGGADTQSMTTKQPKGEDDPLDDDFDSDDDDEDDGDDEDENDREDDEEEEEESVEEGDEPKPQEKKKLFGFLIGSHNICVL